MLAKRVKPRKEAIAPFPLRMKPELRDRLQKLADADRRTLNVFLNLILERFVAALDGKRLGR
jgi:hypothetical protein